MNPRKIGDLAKKTVAKWSADKASTLAAALAFYTMLSLGPLLVVAIAVAGLVFGHDVAQSQIIEQMRELVGTTGAQAISTMVQSAAKPSRGLIATALGVVTLLFGASGVFAALQDAMDTVWHVQPRPGTTIGAFVRQRFLSFAMVLGSGFLLLVSLLASSTLGALGHWLGHFVPVSATIGEILNFTVQLGLSAGLFAAIYKVLPSAKTRWRDVWLGSVVTALMFTIGKMLIGLYLGNTDVVSPYGAAGSLALVLIWVYYSAQILFFGAEFTCVHAATRAANVHPADNAIGLKVTQTEILDEDTLLGTESEPPRPDAHEQSATTLH